MSITVSTGRPSSPVCLVTRTEFSIWDASFCACPGSVTTWTPPLRPSLKVPRPRPPARTCALITMSACSARGGGRHYAQSELPGSCPGARRGRRTSAAHLRRESFLGVLRIGHHREPRRLDVVLLHELHRHVLMDVHSGDGGGAERRLREGAAQTGRQVRAASEQPRTAAATAGSRTWLRIPVRWARFRVVAAQRASMRASCRTKRAS